MSNQEIPPADSEAYGQLPPQEDQAPIYDDHDQDQESVSAEASHVNDESKEVAKKDPPHNFEAEKSLLGAVFLNNLAHEKISEYLLPKHFADVLHASIYEQISLLIARGHVADVISVGQYLQDDEVFQKAGGNQYLTMLMDFPVGISSINDYAKMIYDLYLRRKLIDVGHNMVADAHVMSSEVKATSLIENAESQLFEMASSGDTEKSFVDFKTSVGQALETAAIAHKRDGKMAGVDTGFTELNNLLGGLHKSDLLIVAGRPSMGKTAFATNIAFNAARLYCQTKGEEGTAVAFFSLEMSSSQLASRILSAEAEVQSDKMLKGTLDEHELEKLIDVVKDIEEAPLFIDDTAGITVAALRTKARRLKRQHNIGLIVIDYLQLISGGSKYAGNRVNEVSEITRGLKILAKELDIPVMALSQLSRTLESRDDKRPQLSDLRESGSIEQDADVVMFVYREEYYLSRTEPQDSDEKPEKYAQWLERMEKAQDKADIIIQKQRHGPLGTAHLKWEAQHAQFKNLDTINKEDYTM